MKFVGLCTLALAPWFFPIRPGLQGTDAPPKSREAELFEAAGLPTDSAALIAYLGRSLPADEEGLEPLIRKLGSGRFAERQRAKAQLIAAGHPALLAALEDKQAARRALAACLVGRLGDGKQQDAVRKLLTDGDPTVRLRAAQGLLAARDKTVVPTLIALLEAKPVALAWQAEELLRWVAGEGAPAPVVGAGSARASGECRRAWEGWWRAQGAKVDLAQVEKDHVLRIVSGSRAAADPAGA